MPNKPRKNMSDLNRKDSSRYLGVFLALLAIFSVSSSIITGTSRIVPVLCALYCIYYVYKLSQKRFNTSMQDLQWLNNPILKLILAAAFVGVLLAGDGIIIPLFILILFLIYRKERKKSLLGNVQEGVFTEHPIQEPLPDIPSKKAASSARQASSTKTGVHPVYQQSLDTLQSHLEELESREASVSDFLDDFFAGSSISKSRYLQIIQNAKHVLKNNYEKANQAVSLFGNANPTPERMEILNNYVRDSQDVMNNFERVIDELIKTQQSDVLSDGEVLDSLLDDLARTTSCYQKNPQQFTSRTQGK